MGTEIRTFTSIKDLTEFLTNQTIQYRSLFEDYSQWLGILLRDFESAHKSEEWFQKSAAAQKTLRSQSKKPAETASKGKKGVKGKEESSCWVQSGDIAISFTEQGQTEILFEAIEKINFKTKEIKEYEFQEGEGADKSFFKSKGIMLMAIAVPVAVLTLKLVGMF